VGSVGDPYEDDLDDFVVGVSFDDWMIVVFFVFMDLKVVDAAFEGLDPEKFIRFEARHELELATGLRNNKFDAAIPFSFGKNLEVFEETLCVRIHGSSKVSLV
jgi:hypothetical protein